MSMRRNQIRTEKSGDFENHMRRVINNKEHSNKI